MKKILLSIVVLLLIQFDTFGEYILFDGIYYEITSTTEKTAKVAGVNGGFTGAVANIRSSIFDGTTDYAVTRIDKRAFYSAAYMKGVVIPTSVQSIGDSAFIFCASLEFIEIPESIKSIEKFTFYNCRKLTSVSLSNSLVSIGDSAFFNCNGLQTIVIPNSVTSIGISAFQNCINMTSIKLSESLTYLAKNALRNCYSLKTLTFPNSLTTIERSLCDKCDSLTSITFSNSLVEIKNNAFTNCASLTSLVLPNSLETIGSSAFIFCRKLSSIHFGNSLTTIMGGAFTYNSSLESVTLPSSVKIIGTGAFSFCENLTSFTIPSSVDSIGINAFENCTRLETINVNWLRPLAVDSKVFKDLILPNIVLNVPANRYIDYALAPVWREFKIISLGLEEMDEPVKEVNIYPNPVSEYLSIDFNTQFSHTIAYKIVDTSGKVIRQGLVRKGDRISVENISRGTYFIHFESKDTENTLFRFVKE